MGPGRGSISCPPSEPHHPALPGVVSPGGIGPLLWGNPVLAWALAGWKEVGDTVGPYLFIISLLTLDFSCTAVNLQCCVNICYTAK